MHVNNAACKAVEKPFWIKKKRMQMKRDVAETWLCGVFSVSRLAKLKLNSEVHSGSCSGTCVVTAHRLKRNGCVVCVACPK